MDHCTYNTVRGTQLQDINILLPALDVGSTVVMHSYEYMC